MTLAGRATSVSDGVVVVIENDVHDFDVLDGRGCVIENQNNGKPNINASLYSYNGIILKVFHLYNYCLDVLYR